MTMAEPARQYEVISVSLPRDLVARVNEIVPKARRSRVIRALLSSFVESAGRRRVGEEYAAYYAERTAGEAEAERSLLADWEISDAEAWAILEREESRGRRSTR
jgi:metal-responsive CopG/Arc/MetJ family transcriptional regulator